jgi:hypothetical protein
MTNKTDRSHIEQMCMRRIGNDEGWCVRADEHDESECAGYPSRQATQANTFGPEQAGNRRWG